jgi:hypothetical protein
MGANWQAVSSARGQWQENLVALRQRDPSLAMRIEAHQPRAQYVFLRDSARLQIGVQSACGVSALPNPVPLTSARDVCKKLFPTGHCTEPVMIAGLDHGWLWQSVYELPCSTPRTPGHRPPVYFLARDIERLWLLMHLHDWKTMLGDGRARIFVGEDAVDQCRSSMVQNCHIPWAKLCVTVDPQLWPAGVTVDSLWQYAHETANTRMQQLNRQIETMYIGFDPKSIARRLRGERMRVMGITSQYTTFLKYSMSDWLDAMDALGHETRLVMEETDYQITNPIYFGDAIVEFKPDLILMLDHYRAEITGLPRQVPCVMWVQDYLPNIFNAKAGAAQGPRDYCLGFGRLNLRDSFGYPEKRFMPAQVGVNEIRFAPRELSHSDLDTYACDVSFVSHASTPATTLLTEQLNRADAQGRKLLIDMFEQMRAIYDAGGAITQPLVIGQMLDSSLSRNRMQLDEPSKRSVLDFFNTRVNNALFRHQSVAWLAEMGVNLHLYGRGWENHPRFGKFARGIACNQSQLCTIYQASKINMQITPFGAVHQRLLEGLCAGGFFLLRYCPGDSIERVYQRLYDLIRMNGFASDDEVKMSACPEIQDLLRQASELTCIDQFSVGYSLIDILKLSADGGYIRSAGTVWEDNYDRVAYRSAAELQQRVSHYLSNSHERTQISTQMRQVVLERFTYRSISKGLLDFIADDIAADASRLPATAAA